MGEYGSAFTKTKKGMIKNEVAKGEGVKLQKDDRRAALDGKGIKAGKQPKVSMVKHEVAAGVPARGPASQRTPVGNGSTQRGQPQGGNAKGGVGTPNKEWVDMGVGKLTQFKGIVYNKVK